MPQCVAFGRSNQAKNRKDTSISFHVFPKDNRLRRASIQAVGRTSLPKSPLLCLEYFDAYCFEYTMRLQNELLGSCPRKRNLKPETIPTIFPHKPARSVHDVTFGFLYTSGVSCHCVCVATSCVLTNLLFDSCRCLFSVRLLLEVADRAGLWRKFVGIASGLSFCFQGHDPSSSF